MHSKGSKVPSLMGGSKNGKGQNWDKPMTMAEKRALGQSIRNLPPEHLRGVWEIVSEGMQHNNNREELEFDIDTLPVKITRELEKYVKIKLS